MAATFPLKIGALIFILWMRLSPNDYCISQTPSDPPVNSICVGAGGNEWDFFTLGQRLLRTYSGIGGDTFTRRGDGVASGNDYSPVNTMYVEMYASKRRNSNHFLSGWLVIRVWTGSATNRNKLLNQVMYAQMEDENGNSVGEFSTLDYCDTEPPYKKWDVDEFLPPCGQVAPSATKVSNALMYTMWNLVVNAQEREALKQYYKSNLNNYGTTVAFMFSHTSCNKPEKIRLRAYVRSTSKVNSNRDFSYGTLRTNWMKINWMGAADILHAGERLECLSKLVYIFPGAVQDVTWVPWIERVEPTIPVTGANTNKDIVRTKKFCKAVRFKNGVDHSKVPEFAGRCLKHDEYSVSHNNKHECTAATGGPNFVKYSEYLKKRMSCMKIKDCPCQCRGGRIDNMSGLAVFSSPGSKCVTIEVGVKVNTTAGKYILAARKAHGVAMLLVTMVFVPFNIIISRYFKETWLEHAQLKNVQIWYLVHLAITYMTICLYLFGSVSLRRSNKLLGKSLFGYTHRHLGWLTLALFVLSTVTGPFRPKSSSNLKTRKCSMISHALLGIIYYYLGMAAVITSSHIPGSPSSSELSCLPSPNYLEYSSYAIMPTVVTWICLDIVFHIIYMLLLYWADTNLKIQRSMYLPLISILRPGGGHHDMKGFRYRKLILIIYSVCNGGIVLDLVVTVMNSTKAGCGFGPTTCSKLWSNRTGNISSCGVIGQWQY